MASQGDSLSGFYCECGHRWERARGRDTCSDCSAKQPKGRAAMRAAELLFGRTQQELSQRADHEQHLPLANNAVHPGDGEEYVLPEFGPNRADGEGSQSADLNREGGVTGLGTPEVRSKRGVWEEQALSEQGESPEAFDVGSSEDFLLGAADPISTLLARVEHQLSIEGNSPDDQPHDGEGSEAGSPMAVADGAYSSDEDNPDGVRGGGYDEPIGDGGTSDDEPGGGAAADGAYGGGAVQGDHSPEPSVPLEGQGDVPTPPLLGEIHTFTPSYAKSSRLEGGAENLRYHTAAEESPFYPFRSKEQQLIWCWQHTHHISRKALKSLLEILLFEDDGGGFDVKGLKGVDAEHFNSRMRKYLPLLEVLERDVPSTKDGPSSAKVYDIPLNLILERLMLLSSESAVSDAFPAGKVLRGDEIAENSLASEHVNCVPTVPRDDKRHSNMHGKLARSTPFAGVDGIRASLSGRKVYVHDVCVARVDGFPSPMRILEIAHHEQRRGMMVLTRPFRVALEVRGASEDQRRDGLLRVWEDVTPDAQMLLEAAEVLDVCEIYTGAEVDANKHKGGWELGARSPDWGACVGEGFVVVSAQKRRRPGAGAPRPYQVSHAPWSKEGTPDEPLFVLRREGTHFNHLNFPYYSAPLNLFNDAFSAWSKLNKHSVGGTYVGWAWRTKDVQRLKRQTHVATIASPGACHQGETAMQCEILGELQKGCIGAFRSRLHDGPTTLQQVFVRGTLQMWCADGIGRAKACGGKHPNNKTRFPCLYCMAEQRDDSSGGDLGDPAFNFEDCRRTYGKSIRDFDELETLAGTPSEQTRRSMEVGLNPNPDFTGLRLPLWDSLILHPLQHLPPEILHADALCSSQLCQVFCLELLSTRGRRLVTSIMAQKKTLLYPPGTSKLKDVVTNYSSFTGSQKWDFQTMMLLVFRIVLQDCRAMRDNIKRDELRDLVDKWGSEETVLTKIREVIQVASHLSRALRAPSFDDPELKNLVLLARDVVGFYSDVMGRTGARPTIHSLLHLAEAVELHGVMPDASPGEHAHQLNKSESPVDCGRNPSKHYIVSANTNGALLALSNGLEYQCRKYNRSTRRHDIVNVRPGTGCVRLMQWLGPTLGHDRLPTDIHASPNVTPSQLRGQFPGSAMWSASLFDPRDVANTSGPWDARVATGRHRPDARTMMAGYNTYFGCDGVNGDGCDNGRCIKCSDNEDMLQNAEMECARSMSVSRAQSCGTGRLTGGDARAAAGVGPKDDWVLGEGQGDDVEIFTGPTPSEDGPVPPSQLTIVKIAYFFRHRANRHSVTEEQPPLTWWVVGYDYVGIGNQNNRVLDAITGLPTLQLRGRGRPLVFPVEAIRRQVHLYHQCPQRGEVGSNRTFLCGETRHLGSGNTTLLWRHKFRLATPGATNGYDRYLLNEVQHSINQDTFL